MSFRTFLIAVGALGATVGILHAATQSPTSASVLQILGALIAVCVGVIAGSESILGDRKALKETLPILPKTALILLASYWLGFVATKYTLANTVFTLGKDLAHLSAKERTDAHRLLTLNEALGVPRTVTRQRILELAPKDGAVARCIALSTLNELQILAATADPNRSCKLSLGTEVWEEASALTDVFEAGEYSQRLERLRLSVRLLPKGQDLHALAQDGCLANESILRAKVMALAAMYEGCVPSLEDEIQRVLKSAPEIDSGGLTRVRVVPEKG